MEVRVINFLKFEKMENENNGYEVMQVSQDQSIIQVDAVERANVDSQVATAKQ